MYENCKNCTLNNTNSKECSECNGENNFEELFEADPNCIHNIISGGGGGIICTKCNGWFCF
jgi:hypothetical protein